MENIWVHSAVFGQQVDHVGQLALLRGIRVSERGINKQLAAAYSGKDLWYWRQDESAVVEKGLKSIVVG